MLVESFLSNIILFLIMIYPNFLQVDSLEKLNKLLDACKSLGIETKPMVIDNLGIIPLFSWYHEVISLIMSNFSYSIIPIKIICWI